MASELYLFLKQFLTDERLARFDDVLMHRTRHLSLVLENVHHAHNASACLRTCDCLGIQDVHIIESHNSFEPNHEIALGASQWLTTFRYQDAPEASDECDAAPNPTENCIQHLRSEGYRILATSPLQDSVALDDVPVDTKTAIIFGAEQIGVSETAISQADVLVHIPMFGFTESFNISVSVALVFQHLLNKTRTQIVDWQLSEEEKQVLRERWVQHSLGEKLAPLCRRFEADQR